MCLINLKNEHYKHLSDVLKVAEFNEAVSFVAKHNLAEIIFFPQKFFRNFLSKNHLYLYYNSMSVVVVI